MIGRPFSEVLERDRIENPKFYVWAEKMNAWTIFLNDFESLAGLQRLTQKEIAKRAGTSQSGFSRFYNGKGNATCDLFERITEAVNGTLMVSPLGSFLAFLPYSEHKQAEDQAKKEGIPIQELLDRILHEHFSGNREESFMLPPSPMEGFLALVEKMAERGNLTQKEIAARAGTSQSAISRLLSGGGKPTYHFLRKVSLAVGGKLYMSPQGDYTAHLDFAFHQQAVEEAQQADMETERHLSLIMARYFRNREEPNTQYKIDEGFATSS